MPLRAVASHEPESQKTKLCHGVVRSRCRLGSWDAASRARACRCTRPPQRLL
jgi:hypothetical protein